MYSNANLHVHSSCSDGSLSPRELIELAEKSGLQLLSITDHNSIGAYASILASCEPNIDVILGTELTCRHTLPNGAATVLHICAYFPNKIGESLGIAFEAVRKPLQKICARASGGINERREIQVAAMKKAGFAIEWADVLAEARNRILCEAGNAQADIIDIAAVLQRGGGFDFSAALGMLKYPNEFYVGPGRNWFCFEARKLIRSIIDLGGIACLAHPTKKIPIHCLDGAVAELSGCGLNAIEAYNNTNALEEGEILRIAEKYYLLVTKGNDFHGMEQPINPDFETSRLAAIRRHY